MSFLDKPVSPRDFIVGVRNFCVDSCQSVGEILKPDKGDKLYEFLRFAGYSLAIGNHLRTTPSAAATALIGTAKTMVNYFDAVRIFGDTACLFPTIDKGKIESYNEKGKLVKINGKPVDKNGKLVKINGKPVDKNGKLLKTDKSDDDDDDNVREVYGRTSGFKDDFTNKRYSKMIGQILLVTTLDVVAPLFFLQNHGGKAVNSMFNKFGNMVNSVGNTNIFDMKPLHFITKVNVSQVLRGCLIAIVTCFTFHSIRNLTDLYKYGNAKEQKAVKDKKIKKIFKAGDDSVSRAKKKEMLSIASGVGEVGLQIFSFFVDRTGLMFNIAGVVKTSVCLAGVYLNTTQFRIPS